MRTLKLTIAYDGAAYNGWQRQARGLSIQGLLEDALARIDKGPVTLLSAGRTDAGVHALGQVARARVTNDLQVARLCRAMNAMLPRDVRVLSIEETRAAFHPRFDARSKTYQYWIWNAPVLPPAARGWCWHVPRRLDAEAMHRVARTLVGRHDFSAFQSSGSDVKTTTRTVLRAGVASVEYGEGNADAVASRIVPRDGRFLVFEIEADGFLRHMARALMGTLVDVGDGHRPEDAVAALLKGAARGQAGATAPAHGLVLVRVSYGPCAGPATSAEDPR